MRNVLVCGVVLVLLGFSPTVQAGAPAVVKIGVIEPLSGNAAAAGQATKAAIEVQPTSSTVAIPNSRVFRLGTRPGCRTSAGRKFR